MEKQRAIAGIQAESLVHGLVAGLVGGSVFGVQMAVGGNLVLQNLTGSDLGCKLHNRH